MRNKIIKIVVILVAIFLIDCIFGIPAYSEANRKATKEQSKYERVIEK